MGSCLARESPHPAIKPRQLPKEIYHQSGEFEKQLTHGGSFEGCKVLNVETVQKCNNMKIVLIVSNLWPKLTFYFLSTVNFKVEKLCSTLFKIGMWILKTLTHMKHRLWNGNPKFIRSVMRSVTIIRFDHIKGNVFERMLNF